MEGCYLYRLVKKGNVSSFYDNGGRDVHQINDTIREFRLHFSASKLQNAATKNKNKMIRGRTMWDQTYGCAKQYRCSIAYYLMS